MTEIEKLWAEWAAKLPKPAVPPAPDAPKQITAGPEFMRLLDAELARLPKRPAPGVTPDLGTGLSDTVQQRDG